MMARRDIAGRSPSNRASGCALTVAALAVACSSGGGITPPPASDAGSSSGGSGEGGAAMGYPTGGVVTGSGHGLTDMGPAYVEGSNLNVLPVMTAPCPSLAGTTMTTATKITNPESWASSGALNPGTDNAYSWLLSKVSIDSAGKTTGTTQLCATVSPPVFLTMAGAMAEMVPAGTANWSLSPNSEWLTPKTPIWQQSGTSPADSQPGGAVTSDPHVNLLGLAPTSTLASASAAWPAEMGFMIPSADLIDIDNDGKPGFTALYDHAPGFTDGLADPTNGVFVDQIYVVARTEESLMGTVQPNCVEVKGTSHTILSDSAIVGCHVRADVDGGARDCTTGTVTSEAQGIDTYNPIEMVMDGTFVQRQLKSGATCADVLAAVP